MKKALALLLSVLLILSAAVGCGEKPETAAKKPETAETPKAETAAAEQPEGKKLLGTWTFTMDFPQIMGLLEEEEPGIMEALRQSGAVFSGASLTGRFTFTEEEFSAGFSEAGVNRFLADAKPWLVEAYQHATIQRENKSVKSIERMIQNETGMSFDEYADMVVETDVFPLLYSFFASAADEVPYTFSEGVVKTGTERITVEFVGETELRVTAIEAEEDAESRMTDYAKLLPLTLKKQ